MNCIGIGFETAKFLLLNGATVVLGCRNVDRGESARKQMLDEYQKRNTTQESDSPDLTDVEKRLLLRTIDLSSLKSVRDFAEGLEREGALTRLDLFILNAAAIGILYSVRICLGNEDRLDLLLNYKYITVDCCNTRIMKNLTVAGHEDYATQFYYVCVTCLEAQRSAK